MKHYTVICLIFIANLILAGSQNMTGNIYNIKIKNVYGEETSLKVYQGKKILGSKDAGYAYAGTPC